MAVRFQLEHFGEQCAVDQVREYQRKSRSFQKLKMANGFHLFGYVKHCGCWKDKCGVPVYSLSCIFSFLSVPESTVCFSPLHWVISSILRNTLQINALFPFWKMPTIMSPLRNLKVKEIISRIGKKPKFFFLLKPNVFGRRSQFKTFYYIFVV